MVEEKRYSCYDDESFACCISCHEDDEQGYNSIHQDEGIGACCAAFAHHGVSTDEGLVRKYKELATG